MRHCFVERSDGPATGDLRVTHVRSGPQVDPLTANAPPWARPAARLAESDEHVEAQVRLRGSMRQVCRHCVGVGARQAAAIAGWYPSRWAKSRDVLKAFGGGAKQITASIRTQIFENPDPIQLLKLLLSKGEKSP